MNKSGREFEARPIMSNGRLAILRLQFEIHKLHYYFYCQQKKSLQISKTGMSMNQLRLGKFNPK